MLLKINLMVFKQETEALKRMSLRLYVKYEHRYEALRKDFLVHLRRMELKLEKQSNISQQDIADQMKISDDFISLVKDFEKDFTIMSEV